VKNFKKKKILEVKKPSQAENMILQGPEKRLTEGRKPFSETTQIW
jgi:hypothetical protein